MDDRKTQYHDDEEHCIEFADEGDDDAEAESEAGLLEVSSLGAATALTGPSVGDNDDIFLNRKRRSKKKWMTRFGCPLLCCMLAIASILTVAILVANPSRRTDHAKQEEYLDDQSKERPQINKNEGNSDEKGDHDVNKGVTDGNDNDPNTDNDSGDQDNGVDKNSVPDAKQAPSGTFTPTLLTYECPKRYHQDGEDAEMYREEEAEIVNDIDGYLKSFREREFDDWGYNYNDLKHRLGPYKAKMYSSLKSGDSIYESACGLGLNLVMTLEVLQETHNVTDLVVYGNDFVGDSIDLANKLMDRGILQTTKGHKGQLCQSDSRSLTYVPSDSFDLVFTGYLTPLEDPLQTGLSDEKEGDEPSRLWAFYDKICEGDHDVLKKAATILQENWYSSWVQEMIRITKPGAPIILEQVSGPYCEFSNDWGGVSRDFWYRMVVDGPGFWRDIDPSSLELETAGVFKESRYNVYMRKKA